LSRKLQGRRRKSGWLLLYLIMEFKESQSTWKESLTEGEEVEEKTPEELAEEVTI